MKAPKIDVTQLINAFMANRFRNNPQSQRKQLEKMLQETYALGWARGQEDAAADMCHVRDVANGSGVHDEPPANVPDGDPGKDDEFEG